jgi:DUF4097 and DUF4098 domain-containing protein YvlB
MNTSIIKFIATSSVIATLSFIAQADVVDEIEKTFDVNAQTSFRLDNVNGLVAITAWDKSSIKVIATIRAENQEDLDNMLIDMQQSSDEVNVKTRYKKENKWRKNSHSGKVEYAVVVPKNINLLSIELINGSLTIDKVEGVVKAELVNGSIKAHGLASNGDFRSVNGSIKISYSELIESLDKINVETVNGSIKVSVPKSLNATVEADTMHGSIKTDFGLVAEKNLFSGRHLQGEVGRGDVNITMKSVNGSIKLLKH